MIFDQQVFNNEIIFEVLAQDIVGVFAEIDTEFDTLIIGGCQSNF